MQPTRLLKNQFILTSVPDYKYMEHMLKTHGPKQACYCKYLCKLKLYNRVMIKSWVVTMSSLLIINHIIIIIAFIHNGASVSLVRKHQVSIVQANNKTENSVISLKSS